MAMKQMVMGLMLAGLMLAGCETTREQEPQPVWTEEMSYPAAYRSDHVDELHGVKVADPYRWMESTESEPVSQWVEEENRLTEKFLSQVKQRDAIRKRLTALWNYEKYSVPYEVGGKFFFRKNDGLQSHSVLYWQEGEEGQPQVLLDPNTWSADGTVALSRYSISEDGKYIAYGIAKAGSDWNVWKVREVETGKDLPDTLEWVKFSGASWTHDGKGFFYSRYDKPEEGANALKAANYFQKMYYHEIGTDQSEDKLVYHRPDQKEWGFGSYVTDDGRYLIIYVSRGTDRVNGLFYRDLEDPNGEVVELLNGFDAQYDVIGNDGPRFYIQTDKDAPLSRVVAINIAQPEEKDWVEIIPESKDNLRDVSILNHQFVCTYLHDAYTQVKVYTKAGTFVHDVKLPGIGSARGFGGKPEDQFTFYSFTGFTQPTTIYRYNVLTGRSTVFRKPDVDINPEDYVTKQVFYESKDGTKVPMFIVHKKGIELNGKNPTYLYGYGGFRIPLTPGFSISNLVWMEMGGVYAVANLRGGGEYGKAWHEAGVKLKKQNVFDDFIAAGEYLISEGYTSSQKLAIGGGSNGGLLVGAVMTQRPELFAAAVPAVGVLDMLRFHKFTIGWAWTSDYGSPENEAEFKALLAYSPLHNVKEGVDYPATLVMTGDHDDRVFPAHSYKFAAALQHAQGGKAPILIRIETKAGHGAGKSTKMIIDGVTDRIAFLIRALGMEE